MKLVMYGKDEREARPGVLVSDKIIDLEIETLGFPRSLEEIFEFGLVLDIEDYIEDHKNKKAKILNKNDVYLAAPLSGIGKIVACGLNYKDHAKEMNKPLPDYPLIFAKANSSIAGANEILTLPPKEISKQIDWEVELGVVIGQTCTNVSKEDALNYVGGYLIALDITARDIQEREGQWFRAKSFDGFCPLSEYILTKNDFDDGEEEVSLKLSVNGKEKQNGKLSDMIFDVSDIISFVSHSMTLYAGDLILTGTPSGIGAGKNPPEFLKSGDKIVAEITNLGKLSVNVE